MLICLVPSPEFSQAPSYSLRVHLCWFPVRFDNNHHLETFLGSMASTTSLQMQIVITSQDNEHPDFPKYSPYTLKPELPISGWPSLLRSPIAPIIKYRNINLLPIDYAFQPRLRGRLTLLRLPLSKEPLDCRRANFSFALSLLMSAFALRIPPATFSSHLHWLTECSSTALTNWSTPVASVNGLSPAKSSAQADSTSELLRFL